MQIKFKKIPYRTTVILLTCGASLILGLLSFGGMLVMSPLLSLALAAFALSVAYEGEIYFQNIKGALNKLFKHNYAKRRVANAHLLHHFPDIYMDDCPQFFKDYHAQCKLLIQFEHKTLDKASSVRKKHIQKILADMEKWYARQLFSEGENDTLNESEYQKNLRDWLRNNRLGWDKHLNKLRSIFSLTKRFSVLAALFMGVGTSYLLLEAFAVIPMLATISTAMLPILIVPMAMIAGLAYGLLTYNAMTDLLINNTISQWYNKIRQDLKSGVTLRSAFMAITAVVLAGLAVALTICTAGTWWTVAKQAQPVFAWMGKLSNFIMGVINPLVIGLSAIVFNLQNTGESLQIIDDALRSTQGIWQKLKTFVTESVSHLKASENALQWVNPFRLLIKVTVTPLRILLFIGHLVSIGVMTDRMPGVSKRLSAFFGIVSEGFEDLHYFAPHSCGHSHSHSGHCEHSHEAEQFKAFLTARLSPGHGHNHDLDLPTRVVKIVFIPIYALAAVWDTLSSRLNGVAKRRLSFIEAWNKQRGVDYVTVNVEPNAPNPSVAWRVEHAIYRFERHKEKQLQRAWLGKKLAQDKAVVLTQLQQSIRQNGSVEDALRQNSSDTLNKHRFFAWGKTATRAFLDQLPQRLSP